MLRDYRELAKSLVEKFNSIKEWPEILFDEIDKEKIRMIDDVTIVNNSSIQFNSKENHCIIPSQYVLYAICIKEFAIALREHLDVFDTFKINKDSKTVGEALINRSYDINILNIDDYSKKNALKPLIDDEYSLYAKSIVNITKNRYKIRGTSDFFQSVVLKIINVPDASSQQLGKLIYKLTSNIELYNYLEKKYVCNLPYIVESTVIRKFVRDVCSYLFQYDHFSIINRYLKPNNDKRNRTIIDGEVKLTSIFRVSDSLQTDSDLQMDGTYRFFKEPIAVNDKNQYIYLSTEWTSDTDSRLDLISFKKFIENQYPEFYINIDSDVYTLLPRKQVNFIKEQDDFAYKAFQESTKYAGLNFSDKLITRFVSSLCTKPFVLLSGLSGSGKTKLAQCFAQWICENENQYKIVPVGADWTNREPLLGFPNALNKNEYVKPENGVLDLLLEANKPDNSDKPYFLILDEMNLSHVERYFADFLSAMESKDCISLHSGNEEEINIPQKICLPSNLFIIGTVNIDETTYMFSPKVLDRANTIEFRLNKEEISEYLSNPTRPDLSKLVGYGVNMSSDFLSISTNGLVVEKNETINKSLLGFFGELKKSGAEFGYRTVGEIYRLIQQLGEINSELKIDEKLDIAIMQKLLPKLHGSRRKLEPILETLGRFCINGGEEEVKFFFNHKEENDYSDTKKVKFPLSLEKIVRMHKGAIDNGFASYAEA